LDFLRRLNKDRTGAILLITLGVAVVVQANGYRMGTLTRMGAGFMPTVYGVLIALIGVMLGATAKRGPDEQGLPAEWRGWFCIIGGVLAFVLFGTYGGLIPATFASVFISAMGDRKNTVRDAALLSLAMVIAGTLIFNVGLHLQLPLFGWG
jgi:hypothetical protein